MAMSDCEKCWETPCTCGYKGYYILYKDKIPKELKIESATDVIEILKEYLSILKNKSILIKE